MEKSLTIKTIKGMLRTTFIGQKVQYLKSTTSTMDIARRNAEGGAPEGAVVLAEQQKGGRGRFDRVWISPPGVNLYFSMILYPKTESLPFINMIAALSIVRAIRTITGLDAVIKWPNDVKVNEKKVSGILVESKISSEGYAFLILGVGINVNFDPEAYEEIAATASSLMRESGREVNRIKLLTTILEEFEQLYMNIGDGYELQKAWKACLETLGLRIKVRQMGHLEEGVAINTDSFGNLLLRRKDNSIVVLYAGEVTTQI